LSVLPVAIWGMLPVAMIMIGAPAYVGLLAAAAIGRTLGKHLDL